tara:strand:+ start:519 stop:1070 length:552 start_codon:yes stop_codon:yes gene_type:complete
MADKEVFVNPPEEEETHELIEVKSKKRKPMSDERKAQLKEQLKLAREKKKALKEAGKEIPKEPKLKKVLPATESEPAIYVKNMRKTKIDHTKDIAELKSQIAELKEHNNKSDKEELKQLRLEMKEIKEQQKLEKTQQKKLTDYKKPPPKAPEPKVVKPIVPAPREVPTPRYSTYQKSIWSQFL